MNTSLRAQEWIMAIVAWLVTICCAVILLVKVPEIYGPFSRIQTALFFGVVISSGLALCLKYAQVFLGLTAITIYWDHYPEIRLMFICALVYAGILAAFVGLIELGCSQLVASLLVNGLSVVAFVIGVISFGIRDKPFSVISDATIDGIMGASLTTLYPITLIFTLPFIIKPITALLHLQVTTAIATVIPALLCLVWLGATLGALSIGLAGVDNHAHKYGFPSGRTYWLMLTIGIAMCGGLGKIAYGNWTWLWATALLASGGLLAQQGYHNVRQGKCNLLLVALSCLAWIEIRYVLWNPNLSFNWLINPLLCLSIFCFSTALGKAFRPRAKPQPST